jgi:hypothetical protein
MKRIAIAALAVALLAGCVGTYAGVRPNPLRVTVVRFALLYRADMSISTNGVECIGKADAAAIKAAGEAGGKAAAAMIKSGVIP